MEVPLNLLMASSGGFEFDFLEKLVAERDLSSWAR